ncbi:MAG: hypothetical protein HKN24_05885 [Acidimicrobiales bacterium]|nr:hypothetical protein [Acidimicrobiales bacterium]
MFTWGPKYLIALSVGAWLGAVAYGLITGGDVVGVLSYGFKGGVGEHLGYSLLHGVFGVTAVLAGVLFASRDGEAETLARLAGTEVVPEVTPPTRSSYWGALSAAGVACLMLGVAVSSVFLYLGLAVLFVVAIEWLALAWSDRATGDPETNAIVKERMLGPIEVPMLGGLAIASIMIGISRIFLAVSKTGAVVAGSVVAILIFGTAVVLAQTDAPRRFISAAVASLAVLVIGGGVVGAIAGERELHHGDDHSEDGDHSETEEGLSPYD